MTRSSLVWCLLACLVLAACGGGSSLPGAGPPSDDPPPGTKTTHVLVEPSEGEDIEEIADELGATVLGPVPGTPYYRVALPMGMSMQRFMDELGDDHRIVNADLDVGMSVPEGDGSTLPAGGLLLSTAIPMQEELLRIGADVARARATGAGVRVAVLDSGVLPHEFLDGRVDPDGFDYIGEDADPTDERDLIDSDEDGLTDEGFAHGTFVASLILAVAPDARIVPFRVLDSDGVGNASTVAAAITLAADRGVDVINLSVSMEDRMKVIQDAVQTARDRGVRVVASAGNTGVDDVNFPAALSDAFSVTAVDPGDVLAEFASYGTEVDLTAPGVELLGAYPSASGTAYWSGTSFSAALVSGALALLREIRPFDEPQELLRRLEDTSVPIEGLNPGLGSRLGDGRLDLDAATGP